MPKVNYINIAKKAAATQISELKKINKIFDKSFVQAVEHIAYCKGKVIAAGIGNTRAFATGDHHAVSWVDRGTADATRQVLIGCSEQILLPLTLGFLMEVRLGHRIFPQSGSMKTVWHCAAFQLILTLQASI